MSSTTLKIVAVVAVLLAVILAAAGYQYSRSFAEKAEQAQKAEQDRQQAADEAKAKQTLVVVATKPLLAYEPIQRDAIALVPVSVAPVKPFSTLDDVVGKTPLVDIDTGAPVTQRYFSEGSILARSIPEGHKAVSVEISDVIAVGGFVQPGDMVDVLLYLGGGGNIDQPQSRVLLQNVRVLAYQDLIIDRPEAGEAQEGEKQEKQRRDGRRTAVLAVPDKDVTKLLLGDSAGDLRLALHGLAKEQAENAELPAADPKPAEVPTWALGQLAKPGTTMRSPNQKGPEVEVIRGSNTLTVTVQ